MITRLIHAISDYSDAISLISRHGLWHFVVIPGMLSVLVAGLLVGVPVANFAYGGGEAALESFLMGLFPWEWGKEAISAIIEWIPFWLFLMIGLSALMFFLGKYLIMVIASPFMGALSEKVEEITTGVKPKSDSNFFLDLIRGLRIAVRNLLREILLGLVILLFHLLPVIGSLIATALTFLIAAYYAGFGNMDFTLERKSFNVQQSVKFVRADRWGTIGNGIGFLVVLFIPVLGWFLAPAYGTVSATQLVLRRMNAEGR